MAADKIKLKVTTKNKVRFKKNVPVPKPPQQQHRERYRRLPFFGIPDSFVFNGLLFFLKKREEDKCAPVIRTCVHEKNTLA
jgi:hypothetical protein